MRQGLTPKRHLEMIDLLMKGYSVNLVSRWMDVIPSYIQAHLPPELQVSQPPPPPPIYDPYADYTTKQLLTCDLKSFRQWMIDNVDETITPFSKRDTLIKRYQQYRGL